MTSSDQCQRNVIILVLVIISISTLNSHIALNRISSGSNVSATPSVPALSLNTFSETWPANSYLNVRDGEILTNTLSYFVFAFSSTSSQVFYVKYFQFLNPTAFLMRIRLICRCRFTSAALPISVKFSIFPYSALASRLPTGLSISHNLSICVCLCMSSPPPEFNPF
jgi:hypothetical protein